MHYNLAYAVLFPGNYGHSGMQEFLKIAKAAGICITQNSDKIANMADNETFDKV